MESVEDRLNKLREDRIAREKARIEKLRELNLKKYNKNEPQTKNSTSNTTVANKTTKADNVTKNKVSNSVKNNFHVNGTTKRPISAPVNKNNMPINDLNNIKSKTVVSHVKIETKITNTDKIDIKMNNVKKIDDKKPSVTHRMADKKVTNDNKKVNEHTNKVNVPHKNNPKMTRKSIAVPKCSSFPKPSTIPSSKKSMLPKPSQSASNNRESVFERLYKPKSVTTKHSDEVKKLHTDPDYLKKVLKNSGLIFNKRHTTFEPRTNIAPPVRRSISAVHFKRISKHEINNCIHKWSSIGDKMNKAHLKDINEDDAIQEDKVISAVKSERKKVKFMTPLPQNFNTPRPEELQARLKTWLQNRGKSLDSYQHLQCFGINHMSHREIRPLNLGATPKLEPYDDENKENIALESDSDDDSYAENMNDEKCEANDNNMNTWRAASFVSESIDFNETANTTLTSGEVHNVDELLLGALNDLTELLREGFQWEQCARWLRAIRERFPTAPNSAAYWECRAALEERRGDLPASVQCWEEAIAKGTEHSVVEANLDQLLDKFMQLKISPNSGKRRQVDPKMVDVKNVFKSTIIRFAVQQAKLRQSNQTEAPKYTVTPVRRSGRLSTHYSETVYARSPLRVCASVRQADALLGERTLFVPNDTLHGTP